MMILIGCQAVAVHRKCDTISVSRPHMFTAPSGVPPESESVSSNVCSQQPLLLSCSGYWGLHKLKRHAVWKWTVAVCVCACAAPPMVPLAPWQLKPEHLQRLAPRGALFCIIIKDAYGVWETSAACATQDQNKKNKTKPRPSLCAEISTYSVSVQAFAEFQDIV